MIFDIALGAAVAIAVVLVSPMASKVLDLGEQTANLMTTLAILAIDRPAIVVGATGKLSLERMEVDTQAQAATIGELKIKPLGDTLLRWGSRKFAFVDEVFGVTFDLRDVLVGAQAVEADMDGKLSVSKKFMWQTAGQHTLTEDFVNLALPVGQGVQAVDLNLDRTLRPVIDGSEDARAFERVWEGVRRMFLEHGEGLPVLKLMAPVFGFIAGGAAAFYLFGPGAMPFSDNRIVSIGLSIPALWVGAISRTRLKRFAALLVTMSIVGLLVWYLPYTVVGILGTVVLGLFVVIGLGPLLPMGITGPIAELLLRLGLLALDDPALLQDDGRMQWIDADVEGPRYRLAKTFVTFAVRVDESTFGKAGMRGGQLQRYRSTESVEGLPDDLQLATVEKGGVRSVVPTRQAVSDHAGDIWIRTDRWLRRFADAATGRLVEIAQREATKEFGAGDHDVDDDAIMMRSLAASIGGFAISTVIWVML
jgi:hypothetical protein